MEETIRDTTTTTTIQQQFNNINDNRRASGVGFCTRVCWPRATGVLTDPLSNFLAVISVRDLDPDLDLDLDLRYFLGVHVETGRGAGASEAGV